MNVFLHKINKIFNFQYYDIQHVNRLTTIKIILDKIILSFFIKELYVNYLMFGIPFFYFIKSIEYL